MNLDDAYLTFDIDWTCDEAVQYVLDKLEQYSCKATFFITHESPLIERMKENEHIELGLHPNFRKFLCPDKSVRPYDLEAPLRELKNIVPDAVSVRCHSLIQGTVFFNLFKDFDLLVDCNPYIPYSQGVEIRPWRFWTGTLVVPFVWSDYIDALRMGNTEPRDLLVTEGVIKSVVFHPIHVYLNISTIEEYEHFRSSGMGAVEYRERTIGDKRGIGNIFDDFLQEVNNLKISTAFVKKLLDQQER